MLARLLWLASSVAHRFAQINTWRDAVVAAYTWVLVGLRHSSWANLDGNEQFLDEIDFPRLDGRSELLRIRCDDDLLAGIFLLDFIMHQMVDFNRIFLSCLFSIVHCMNF